MSPILIITLATITFAADNRSVVKEEIVYVVTDASGNVNGTYVVNIIEGGTITDYGNYSEVKILNINDPITLKGDKVTITTSADKIYYEGVLINNDIPWIISISYYIDGIMYPPDQVAGMSGALEMKISVRDNPNCNNIFFDHYTLQATITLDTERFTEIQANGATQVYAGSDKKLSYIILPKSEKDIVITANVINFALEPIEIIGLIMDIGEAIDLNTDAFDLQDYDNAVSDLKSAASALDNGASELRQGISSLVNGTEELCRGLASLDENSSALINNAELVANTIFSSATKQLQTELVKAGMSESDASQIILTQNNYIAVISDLSDSMPTESQISSAESAIRNQLAGKGIEDNTQQNIVISLAANMLLKEEADTVGDALAMSGVMIADAFYVQEAIVNFSSSTDPAINKTILTLTEMFSSSPYNLDPATATAIACTALGLDANNPSEQINEAITKTQNAAIVSATTTDHDSIQAFCTAAVHEQMIEADDNFTSLKKQLDGIMSFLKGIETYTDGVAYAASGASTLLSGSASLLEGADRLADGTSRLRSTTGSLDVDITSEVKDKIQEAIDNYRNTDFTPVSFASRKNTNVNHVQFVIKTSAVELSEKIITKDDESEALTFWQKLLRLFGL